MGAQAIEIKCPGCGAPERIDSVKCRYCHQPLSISSFSTISEMAAPMVNKYAGTYKRAPQWWQEHSLEWLYRLIKEPKRMWRRYVLGNPLFLWNITLEAIGIR